MEKEERTKNEIIENILLSLNTEIKSIENIELEDDIPLGPDMWLKVHKLKKAYDILKEYKYK